MTKDDFEELLTYTDIHDGNDVRIAIKAGGEVIKAKASDFIMLAEALGVNKDSVRHWFEGRNSPASLVNRKYVIEWLQARIANAH